MKVGETLEFSIKKIAGAYLVTQKGETEPSYFATANGLAIAIKTLLDPEKTEIKPRQKSVDAHVNN